MLYELADLEETLRQAEWAARAIELSYNVPEPVASALVSRARERLMRIRQAIERGIPRSAAMAG